MRDNIRKKSTKIIYLIIPIPKKLNFFHQLQKSFISSIILYYFNEKRQLYVNLDVNKEFDFDIHIYHLKNPGTENPGTENPRIIETDSDLSKQKSQQPILFLNRFRINAKTHY